MQRLLVLALLLGITACSTTHYYAQLASGQWVMFSDREPIDSLLQNPDTEDALRERLLLVQSIRDFASTDLGLPDNPSYRYYLDLDRPYAVWNVYAAAEFSVAAKEWCFPIAGCVAYRGYFHEQKAIDYANGLAADELDTYVGGVAAYSTLGWFDDPALNTFIYRDNTRLAGLVFHELAHQQVYLPGDTAFNESFARAVEIEGVRRWLSLQQQPQLISQYLLDQQMHRDFVDTLLAGRQQLQQLYAEPLLKNEMRHRKKLLLARIQEQDYPAFKRRWDGTRQYDAWMGKDFNNAKLATIANYHQWLPAFQQLFADNDGDFSSFYKDVKALSGFNLSQRNQQLEALAARASAKLRDKNLLLINL